MNKLAVTLLFVILLQACSNSKESKKASLPESNGQLQEMVVVSDSKNQDSAFKELIKSVYGKSIEGFPPPFEPTFKVLITDEKFFKGYFRSHHNIVVLLTEDNLEVMQPLYGASNEDKIQEIISNTEALGLKQKNLWAQNQNVFYVTAKDQEAMKQKLQSRSHELLEVVLNQEKASGTRKLYTTSSSKDSFFIKSLQNKGYGIRKPKSYRVAVNKNNFTWLRKSPAGKELEYGMLMFDVPYTNENQLKTDSLLSIRNRFTKKHIPGEFEDSYMGYSDVIIPQRKQVSYDGYYCIQLKGWFDMVNDYMGGPSLIKTIVDHKNGKLIFVEGFVFHPNERKAKHVRELEIIMNSLKINDKS